jgi:diaminohydroxyphosphoribosylaminopyrimidine deaminase/5-amino-6-(5-phosphoribosylamino)uracil reductase
MMREHRPLVILKAAMSLDGCIAEGWPTHALTSPANRHAHGLRAEVDAIGVGAGTILADDPQLTPRALFASVHSRVIFDRRLRTPARGRARHAPRAVITSAAAARNQALRSCRGAGAEVEVRPTPFPRRLTLAARQ